VGRVRQQFSWKFFAAIVTAGVLIAFAFEFCDPAEVQAQTLKTGPAIGETIPAFQLPDPSGETRNFESLRGPKGLLLLFHRSADW
jgi:hypothetical protein